MRFQDLDDANTQIDVLHKRYGLMYLTVQSLVVHPGCFKLIHVSIYIFNFSPASS